MFSCIGDVLVSTSTKYWTCKILQSNENHFQVVALNSLGESGPWYFQISHSLLLSKSVMEANKWYDARGIWLGLTTIDPNRIPFIFYIIFNHNFLLCVLALMFNG